MTGVTLNPTAGKLFVEGQLDLQAIRAEGRKENYRIRLTHEAPPDPGWAANLNTTLLRTVAAGVLVVAGFAAEKLGAAPALFLPLYVLAIVFGGWGNFRKAALSLPKLDFNMSVLMSVAIVGAAGIGAWEEGAVVAFLFSASEMLESWTLDRARRSIAGLVEGVPKTARVERAGVVEEVPVEEVRVDDVMVVRPGERLAMDGIIETGDSSLDEAAITGESVPIEKGAGQEVFAGTMNAEGLLRVRVKGLAGDTMMARIVHMVEEAQARRAPSQAFVDRFAAVYTPIVLSLAAVIVLVPPLLLGRTWEPWIYRGLALLIVSCPCALVVSTPVSVVSAISNAARKGVLIKGGVYLERMGAVRAVAFDKTGTLTEGRPSVSKVIPFAGIDDRTLLSLAASLEAGSDHPLAQAIVREAVERGIVLQPPGDVQSFSGLGVRGTVAGRVLTVGNTHLLADKAGGPEATGAVRALHEAGASVVLVADAADLLGIIGIADTVRPASPQVLQSLRRAGIEHTVMLTGDNPAAATAIALEAGVDDFRAELLPEAKVEAVEALLTEYGTVAMVGDGINDAPALATASVGIAMGGAGSDTALETADIALMADDLAQLPFTVGLSRATLRAIKFNIAFAIGVKLLAILLVFPGWLTLWLAIMSDMGASIAVTLNGMRLLAWRGRQPERR